MRLRIYILTCVLALTLGCINNSRHSFESYHERGYDFFQKKRFKLAIREFTSAIEINPFSANTFMLRGISCIQLSQHACAIDDLTKSIEVENWDNQNESIYKWQIERCLAESYVWRGLANYEIGNHGRALNDFSESITLNPINPRAYLWRAHVHYWENNDIDAAISDFEHAIRDHSQNAIELFVLPDNFVEICTQEMTKAREHHAINSKGAASPNDGVSVNSSHSSIEFQEASGIGNGTAAGLE